MDTNKYKEPLMDTNCILVMKFGRLSDVLLKF